MMGGEATKWFLRYHFRNHGLTVLRYFLKRGFMEMLVKAYNICVTMVAQGHRHQLSIPHLIRPLTIFAQLYFNELLYYSLILEKLELN